MSKEDTSFIPPKSIRKRLKGLQPDDPAWSQQIREWRAEYDSCKMAIMKLREEDPTTFFKLYARFWKTWQFQNLWLIWNKYDFYVEILEELKSLPPSDPRQPEMISRVSGLMAELEQLAEKQRALLEAEYDTLDLIEDPDFAFEDLTPSIRDN